jgi:hypothetical protein
VNIINFQTAPIILIDPVSEIITAVKESHQICYALLSIPAGPSGHAKAWVCGCSLAGNVGSNPAEVMEVCLVFYAVR